MDSNSTDPCTTAALPFDAASVRRARSMMSEELERAGTPRSVIDDAQLVLSELLTNGLRHGRAGADDTIEVGWCRYDDRVLVCVHDAGTTSGLAPLELDPNAMSGRGLALVDHVCDAWTWDSSRGTRIIAEIAIAS